MTKKSFDEKLTAYAELAVKVGVNLQPGQRLVIRAPIESAPFVQKMAACAYQIGSPLVSVMYNDDQLNLIRFQNAPAGSFDTFPEWEADALVACAERGDAFIRVAATDPDLLKDENPDDVSVSIKSAQRHLAKYMKYPMSDAIPWLVISMPIPRWATKVFPGLSDEEATEKLWDAMFKACRMEKEDPIKAW
ncbi:MAG: aminopeptidase, partial [Opitutales bacterium]|nr:aminopeptidase [Opitutales bacterium]